MINKKLVLNGVRFTNRVVVSPMCQYMANNGCPSGWHYHHLRNLIETGAGSLVVESTAVSKVGRITEKDLCLYNFNHYKAHKNLVRYLKNIKNIPLILQLSHSGRKGSAEIPWLKKNQSLKSKKKWTTISPSSLKRSKNWAIPKEMSLKDINKVVKQFKISSKLAFKAGYDGVEIHMAHGYLIHQFCSPISNLRNDEYGIVNKKYKFPLEIVKEIKKIRPNFKIIGARVTGMDHLKNGIKINDAINLITKLKKVGLNYVCISSGGIIPITKLKFFKGFRYTIAKKIKKKCKIITRTSGLINDYKTIKKFLNKGKIDMVAIGRKFVEKKFFLINEKEINIKNEIKQYKYCFKN